MTVEVQPLGVTCNLQCTYCYQHPMRDAGHTHDDAWDLEGVQETLAKLRGEGHTGTPTLFGGEALLTPLPQLEQFLAWSVEQYGDSSIQSNAALCTEEHFALFERYRTNIGVSMDGPGPLNDARWAGSLAKTREATAATQRNLERLITEGRTTGIIVTLSRANGLPEHWPAMMQWFRALDDLGLGSSRLHVMESDSAWVREHYALTPEQCLDAMIFFNDHEQDLPKLRFDVFGESRQMLMADNSQASCVWVGCDPLNTGAVMGVGADGAEHNCGRTNTAGIDWEKAEGSHGWERQYALYNAPQEAGGCQDCRFWLMCRGQCPGTATDSDWRNRSEFCLTWKGMFAHIEGQLVAEGKVPLSIAPDRVAVEQRVMANLRAGGYGGIQEDAHHGDHTDTGGATGHGDQHGDSGGHADQHGDSGGHGDQHGDSGHGDAAHGDAPHGDAPHGDM